MKRIIDYIKRIHEVAYKNGKSTLIMTIDIGIWYIFYGATLTDYFNYEFYNKSFKTHCYHFITFYLVGTSDKKIDTLQQ